MYEISEEEDEEPLIIKPIIPIYLADIITNPRSTSSNASSQELSQIEEYAINHISLPQNVQKAREKVKTRDIIAIQNFKCCENQCCHGFNNDAIRACLVKYASMSAKESRFWLSTILSSQLKGSKNYVIDIENRACISKHRKRVLVC